jgi:hypothetical protein
MPPSGSPLAGSYTYPQTVHTYFFIFFTPLADLFLYAVSGHYKMLSRF